MKQETPNNNIADLIKQRMDNKDIPVINFTRDIPVAAMMSKFVRNDRHQPNHDSDGNREVALPDFSSMQEDSATKIQDINDAESVLQVLPDLGLAGDILVSSIEGPKDMGVSHINYIAPVGMLHQNTTNELMNIVKDYCDNYKIATKVGPMLNAMLIEKGSYPIVVVPENVVDEVINNAAIRNQAVTMESLDSVINTQTGNVYSTGILGPGLQEQGLTMRKQRNQFTLEGITPERNIGSEITVYDDEAKKYLNTNIHVIDNIAALSLPNAIALRNQIAIERLTRIGAGYGDAVEESISLSDRELENIIYSKMSYQHKPVVALKTDEQAYRQAVGEPLVMHIPSEAVLPVFTPGDPSNHVGYYILLDNNYHPVSRESSVNQYADMRRLTMNNQQGAGFASNIINRVDRMMNGDKRQQQMSQQRRMDEYVRTYGELVENDLLARLKNGIYGQQFKIGDATEFYRVMFFRSLANQNTQLLFVPRELMTYMAFFYGDNGMGKSLLDKMKVINGLRMSLTFADVRAAVSNSINRKHYDIQLDPNSPDPNRDMAIAWTEILRSHGAGVGSMPIGTVSPTEIENWMSRAAITTTFHGHPSIPDMKIDRQETRVDIPKSDADLREHMDKRGPMIMGVPGENVDSANGADYAETVSKNNVLFNKRVAIYQSHFEPQFTSFVIQLLSNSPKVIGDMTEVMYNSFDEVIGFVSPDNVDSATSMSDTSKIRICRSIAKKFISQIKCELPKANILPLKAKLEAFKEYKEAVEEALLAVLSDDVLSADVIGEMENKATMIRDMVKSHLLRQWLIKNDFLPELIDLVMPSDIEKDTEADVLNQIATFAEAITKNMASAVKKFDNLAKTTNQYMDSQEIKESDGYDSSTSGSSDSSRDSGGDGFDFGGDFGDGGGDDGSGGKDGEKKDDEDGSGGGFDFGF